MKSKLLAVLAIVMFSGIFAGCAEDEVLPTEKEKKGVTRGIGEDDKGF